MTQIRQFVLRKQTLADALNEAPIDSLPVVFRGTAEEARRFAVKNGFLWRDSKYILFGGYWFKPSETANVTTPGDSEVLLLDIAI